MVTMKFTTQTRNTEEGWGMGFLLIFFPEEDDDGQNQSQHRPQNVNDLNFLSKPSSSPIKRSANSSSNLLQKAQSTISICLLILFATLLLFTLSTLPQSSSAADAPRRRLRESASAPSNLPHALQGMGTLYRRGTRAMNDVVLAHSHDNLSMNEVKLFVRLFLRSGLASKSDLVLVLPSKTANLAGLIIQEQKSFVELMDRYGSRNGSDFFDPTHFTMRVEKREREAGEPIWGQKTRTNHTEKPEPESNQTNYGSVVGFDVDELDPEISLSGFLDHVPMNLRRWACYPMLLGRVRRKFKHVMLVDMKEILLLGDPLIRIRRLSPESVLVKSVTSQSNPRKHDKRSSEKTESTRRNPVHPGIVMGGSIGVRRLSSTMLTGIVRASMIQSNKKKKNLVSESSIFNQLVGNEYVLKNVNLIVSTEPLLELSSADGSVPTSGSQLFTRKHGLIRRGNSNTNIVNSMVMKHICSFPIASIVYSDCMK